MESKWNEIFCPDCGHQITESVAKQVSENLNGSKRRTPKRRVLIVSAVALCLLAAITISLILLIPKIKYREEDKMVEEALQLVTDAWEEEYEEREEYLDFDKKIIIKNTRIVKIKNNDSETFKDVDYVVEFSIFSDYFASAPYYMSYYGPRFVMFYKNGKAEIYSGTGTDPFGYEGSRTYDFSFKHIVDEVVDLDDRYNQTIEFD